jgi:hypothetical protein
VFQDGPFDTILSASQDINETNSLEQDPMPKINSKLFTKDMSLAKLQPKMMLRSSIPATESQIGAITCPEEHYLPQSYIQQTEIDADQQDREKHCYKNS